MKIKVELTPTELVGAVKEYAIKKGLIIPEELTSWELTADHRAEFAAEVWFVNPKDKK